MNKNIVLAGWTGRNAPVKIMAPARDGLNRFLTGNHKHVVMTHLYAVTHLASVMTKYITALVAGQSQATVEIDGIAET